MYRLRPFFPRPRGARRIIAGAAPWLPCALVLLAAPACSRPDAVEVRRPDRTITVGLSSDQVDVRPLVRTLTTLQLVGTSPDGRPSPGLLQSWTLSPDGRTWDFALQPDVVRHDGAAVTADDVAARIRAQVGYDPPAGLIDIEQVEAVDRERLRIRLREPSGLLLEALTLTRAVPAGAFMSQDEELEATSSPVLPAHRAATGSAPSVARVVVRRYDTPRAAWSALLRDEIDLLHEVSGEARPFLEQDDGIEVRPFLKPFVMVLGLNLGLPTLRRLDVRLALNHAVDREELLAQDFGGRGLVAATPVWPRHWAADASLKPYAYDPARARRLLDAAGLRPRPRTDGRPSRLRLTCLVVEGLPRLERAALRMQRAYAAVGIDLVLEAVPLDVLGTRVAAGEFETFLTPLIAGYGANALYHMWGRHSPDRFFAHGYDAAEPAAEALRRAYTDEQVREALQALQRVLFDDPPAVFLLWEEAARAVGRRFDVPSSSGRDILSTLAQWTPRVPVQGSEP